VGHLSLLPPEVAIVNHQTHVDATDAEPKGTLAVIAPRWEVAIQLRLGQITQKRNNHTDRRNKSTGSTTTKAKNIRILDYEYKGHQSTACWTQALKSHSFCGTRYREPNGACDIRVRAANGSDLPIMGRTRLTGGIGMNLMEIDAYVTKHIPGVILGKGWLQRQRARWNFED
jgi:hypothetical protein